MGSSVSVPIADGRFCSAPGKGFIFVSIAAGELDGGWS